MDFLKKNPYPLAAYCFALYSVLQVFNTSGVVSTLSLLAYIFLTVMLVLKRRDLVMVVAAGVPCVVNLLGIIVYGTTFLGFLSFLVSLTVPAFTACFLLPQLEPHVSKCTDTLKKLWFLPAAGLAVILFLQIITGLINAISLSITYWYYTFFEALSYTGMPFMTILRNILIIGGDLLLCAWIVSPEGMPQFTTASAHSAPAGSNASPYADYTQPASSGFRPQNTADDAANELEFSMVGHILLLLFVGVIWQYIWIYRTTKALNRVPGEEDRNPTTKLLLCMFVPFYYIYWTYKSAQRIDKLAASRGVQSDIGTLCLILSILIGIVPPMIMQDKMNAIAATYRTSPAETSVKAPVAIPERTPSVDTAPVYQAPVTHEPPVTEPLVQPQQDVVAQMKQFKELLDSGIITQEEFDAKKKQLLDL